MDKRAPDLSALIDRAQNYPFERTGYSYLYLNRQIIRITEFDTENWNACKFVGADHKEVNFSKLCDLHGVSADSDIRPLSSYTAVIASGSNASPHRLVSKYGEREEPTVFPVIKAKIRDFVSVYSAHFTRYGSIAATLQYCPGAHSEVYVTFLDEEQLKLMHETESLGSHYVYSKISNIEIDIPSRGRFDKVYLYVTLGGCIHDENSFLALAEIDSENCSFRKLRQREMLEYVFEILGGKKASGADDVEKLIAKVIQSDAFRVSKTKELRRHSRFFEYYDLEHLSGPGPNFSTDPLYVRKTGDRNTSKDEYIAILHPDDWARIDKSRFGVVSYQHPVLGERVCVPCRIVSVNKPAIATHQIRANTLNKGCVAIDQSLRNALGIPYKIPPETMVYVHKLRVSKLYNFWVKNCDFWARHCDFCARHYDFWARRYDFWARLDDFWARLDDFRDRLVSRCLGRRYGFLRVCRAFVNDMEKNFCRISPDAMDVVGAEVGGKIRLEFPSIDEDTGEYELRSCRLKAYASTKESLETRIQDEVEELKSFLGRISENSDEAWHKTLLKILTTEGKISINLVSREDSKKIVQYFRQVPKDEGDPGIRYQNPEVFFGLGHEPDILRIFLDHGARKELGTDLLHCVRARRDVRDQFLREFVSVGLLFGVAVLSLAQLIPSKTKTDWGWPGVAVAVGAALVFSVFVVLTAIRSRIK